MLKSDEWRLTLPELPTRRERLWNLACPFVHEAEFENWIKRVVIRSGTASISSAWSQDLPIKIFLVCQIR